MTPAVRGLGMLAAAVAGFFLPALLGAVAPGVPVMGALVVIAIFAVMAYGLDIILSDLGEVSLAHTALGRATRCGRRAGANSLVARTGDDTIAPDDRRDKSSVPP